MEQYATIFNIQRFSVHDGPGARTTVFFKGCNLHCVWCHNPESIPSRNSVEFYPEKCIGCGECIKTCRNFAHTLDALGNHCIIRKDCVGCLECCDGCFSGALVGVGRQVDADYLMKQILSDRDYYIASDGGVTFSGGECMLQIDFLEEILRRCKEQGIHTAVDTAGNVPRSYFERILPYTDLFLYDIKAADGGLHKILTGVDNKLLLENLRFICEQDKPVIIRIPFIPSKNGGEVEGIAETLSPLAEKIGKIELLPFHKLGASKYKALNLTDRCTDEIPPSDEVIENALNILRSKGLNATRS